jgi:hypothetical protein
MHAVLKKKLFGNISPIILKGGALNAIRFPEVLQTLPFHLISSRSTTILCVRKNGKVVMAGDGQVSQGGSVVKGNARKV